MKKRETRRIDQITNRISELDKRIEKLRAASWELSVIEAEREELIAEWQMLRDCK
jgi:hypothetical protein